MPGKKAPHDVALVTHLLQVDMQANPAGDHLQKLVEGEQLMPSSALKV